MKAFWEQYLSWESDNWDQLVHLIPPEPRREPVNMLMQYYSLAAVRLPVLLSEIKLDERLDRECLCR